MKTLLIMVGKTTNKHFVAGISDYAERIGTICLSRCWSSPS